MTLEKWVLTASEVDMSRGGSREQGEQLVRGEAVVR